MAKLKGKTEFARRVEALGLTMVELAELTGYKKSTLYNYSSGHQEVPTQLWKMLEMIEAQRSKLDK